MDTNQVLVKPDMATKSDDQCVPDLPKTYPCNNWEPQQHCVQRFQVQSGCSEWLSIEAKFKVTMPTTSIIAITRIQNTWGNWNRRKLKRKWKRKNETELEMVVIVESTCTVLLSEHEA